MVAGTSETIELSFDLVFTGTFSAGDTALVTNAATAATTTEEPITDNNSDSVQTILTPVASVDPGV